MSNSNKDTTIDIAQVFRRSFDSVEEGLRIVFANASFQIELDANDGDTVGVRFKKITGNAGVTNLTTPGTIVAAVDSTDTRLFNLYTICNTTITGSAVFSLQVSPDDSANVWVEVATLTASNTATVVNTLAAPISVAARRVRVNLTTAPTTGTATVYLVGT